MHATVEKYRKEFQYAQANIVLHVLDEETTITIDNDLLQSRPEGLLLLRFEKLLAPGNADHHCIANAVGWAVKSTWSTRVEFKACDAFHKKIKDSGWKVGTKRSIG